MIFKNAKFMKFGIEKKCQLATLSELVLSPPLQWPTSGSARGARSSGDRAKSELPEDGNDCRTTHQKRKNEDFAVRGSLFFYKLNKNIFFFTNTWIARKKRRVASG